MKSPLSNKLASSVYQKDYVYASYISAWHASGPEFDLHVRHILSWRLGHETNSTAILPLPLIQEEQLSVTGEIKCALSTGKLPRRLAQEQCG